MEQGLRGRSGAEPGLLHVEGLHAGLHVRYAVAVVNLSWLQCPQVGGSWLRPHGWWQPGQGAWVHIIFVTVLTLIVSRVPLLDAQLLQPLAM